jgi:hypothetical protein
MKTLQQVIILSLVLTGFANQLAAQEVSKPQSDSELRQKIAGVWKYTSDTSQEIILKDIYTFSTNGYFSKVASFAHKTNTKTTTGYGTWQIKNGYIVTTVTKVAPLPQGLKESDVIKNGGNITRLKIVSVDEHSLVLENNPTIGTESQKAKVRLITLTK